MLKKKKTNILEERAKDCFGQTLNCLLTSGQWTPIQKQCVTASV